MTNQYRTYTKQDVPVIQYNASMGVAAHDGHTMTKNDIISTNYQ